MSECVLDASALLALLNNEPGAEKVEKVLTGSKISAVNASEVIAELYKKLNILPEEGSMMVSTLVNQIVPFDLLLAEKAATLRNETSHLGLSLGDRACLALGLHLSLPVYTADKIWQNFSGELSIIVIRE